MNILYLHGLNGSLSQEKRTILENYGAIYAPEIDYESYSNSTLTIIEKFQEIDINVVMGSSMGGFVGYHVSNAFQRPALLFNPALVERSVKQNIPETIPEASIYKQFVLGTHDAIVDPKLTLQFIAETLTNHPEYKVHIHKDLSHRIPMAVFEEEVRLFFNPLCY